MPAPSLAPFIRARPWLSKLVTPVANMYSNAAGYRQMGLRADDLISEENENVLTALKRLPAKESYDRIYRIRRATQLSLQHKLLPKAEWTKPEEDVPYLGPLLAQIEAEQKEVEQLDTLTVIKAH
ncbi:cytochrome b-c1 complex subunit 7 [Cercophora newfieldiana]|uniref:Cytochrome b-c1 complex subunit 7 n=1 Tax=Cercophora newfieldiana TaxID=92897 RepID=A0AA39YJ84_9PEZI|nr:cytochrome b-c1 complex subunit 7 [Cercophora newfieldiana]